MSARKMREKGIKIARRVGFKDRELFLLIRNDCWDAILERAMEINPKKTKKALNILIKNGDLNANNCWFIAVSRNAPVGIQKRLANHKYWSIRNAVAENIYATPVNTLRKLTKDRNKIVCQSAEDSLESLKTESFKTLFGGEVRNYP